MFLSPNIEAHKGKGLSETMIDADKLLKQEDYLMALENLLPVYEKAAGNFLYNIAVADAYRGLHLFKPAMHFYNAASAANRNSGLPDFEMGLLFIAQKKWADAEASFKSAKDKGYANKQMLNYYLGVSQYNQGDALGAEIAFKASLWESKNSDLKESAQAFLQGLGDDNAVGAIGTAGIGYDSNPYRWGKGSRTDNYRTKAGALYRGFGSVFYRPKDDAYGHFKLAFDIEKKGFFESDLENIETLSQKLYVDWKANFFLDENLQSALSVRLVPFLELFSFGENRSADKYGAHVEVGNESWVWAPRLLIGYTFLVDPLPGRDDKLDPILLEPIQPSDRSAVITNFGLGFRLVRQPDLFADLLGSYITVGQRNELIEIDDFNEINIRVEAEHILNQYIHLSLTPGYFNRTFPNSRDSRKDSGYLLDLGLSYYFTQAFYHDFKAHYRNQDSNRNVSSYNQYYATANFTLEL